MSTLNRAGMRRSFKKPIKRRSKKPHVFSSAETTWIMSETPTEEQLRCEHVLVYKGNFVTDIRTQLRHVNKKREFIARWMPNRSGTNFLFRTKQSFKMLQESSTHREIIERLEGTQLSRSRSKELLKYTWLDTSWMEQGKKEMHAWIKRYAQKCLAQNLYGVKYTV